MDSKTLRAHPEMIDATLVGYLIDGLENVGHPTILDPRPLYKTIATWTPEERREAFLWAQGTMGYADDDLPDGASRPLRPGEQPHPMPPCVRTLIKIEPI